MSTPFEPTDAERPPPYESPAPIIPQHVVTSTTNAQAPTPVLQQQVVQHRDVEACRGSMAKKERRERNILRHKILLLTLMTFFLLLFLSGLSEPDDDTKEKLKQLFEKDLGLELTEEENLLTKGLTMLISFGWFLTMFYAVVRERYSLLVFSCVIAVIIVILCIATSILIYLAVPQMLWLMVMLITCLLGALMMNSMVYLIKTLERDT